MSGIVAMVWGEDSEPERASRLAALLQLICYHFPPAHLLLFYDAS
jgi:hypothetical protein